MDSSEGNALRSYSFRPLPLVVIISLAINCAPPATAAEQQYQMADDSAPVATPVVPSPIPAAPATRAPAAPAATDKSAQENVFWQSVEHSNTAADYKAYLDAFPTGLYAALAKNRIAALNAPPPPTPPPVAPQPIAVFPSAFGPPPPAVSPEALRNEIGTVDAEASLGMGPPQRMELQQRLTALGLYNGPIDGDLGPGVRTAIAEWQKRYNLAATGEIGPLQLAALRVESEANFQQLLAIPHPPVGPRPIYYAPRVVHVYHSAPSYVAPAALGILGGLALGILGSKMGGKSGGGGGHNKHH
jgi:hypothetical protein